MLQTFRFRRIVGLGLALGVVGCADERAVLAPEALEQPSFELALIACSADRLAQTVSCAAPVSEVEGPSAALIVGGQGTHVTLASSNVSYDGGTEEFTFDVTVQNLIPQPLATTDGETGTTEGVRIFFHQSPVVTSGTGSITVAADGATTYTASNQPYYQYTGGALGADGLLATDEISSARTWQFDMPATVNTFTFLVYVATDVEYPNGWVDITSSADTVLAGSNQALTATVRTATGHTVDGAVVAWEASDTTVATVDAGGNVATVAPGSVSVTATSGLRTGMVALAVCPDLDVGEVYTAVMPGASSLCLAGGTSGNAEYTYSPINFSTGSALSLSLTANGIVAATGPPTPSLSPRHAQLAFGSELGAPQLAEDSHFARLERDRRESHVLLGRTGARVDRSPTPGGPSFAIVSGVPAVGDLWSLNVASGCSGALDSRTGRIVSVGTHAIIVADTMNPAGGFTTAQWDSIALEFDSIAFPVATENFGGPTDLDNNSRVVAFYTRAVNELSAPGSSSIVNGFFTTRDLFSAASCPRSNEGEIFYMLVPDPTGAVNGNVRTVSSVRGGTVGTMGHELQHLINASRRIYVAEAAVLEEVWLNEGLSHIVEELMFYRTAPGLAPRGNIVLSTLTSGPDASARVAAFNRFASQNFGRLRSFLERPDTAGAFKNTDHLSTRGATWAFLRYAADRRNGDDATFWYDLVNTGLAGSANLEDVLGQLPNDWIRDWIAAMHADDAITGIASEYQTTSWNFRSVYGGLNGFPLGTRTLSNGVPLTLSYSFGGGAAYARFAVPTGGFAGITALSAGLPPTSPYALIVTRTK